MEIRDIHASFRFSSEKMQKVKLFGTGQMFLDVYCLEPGQSQKVHTHDNETKIYVVLEGTARFHVSSEVEDVGAGHAVLARPGEPHGVENVSGERVVLLVGMVESDTRAVSPPAAKQPHFAKNFALPQIADDLMRIGRRRRRKRIGN